MFLKFWVKFTEADIHRNEVKDFRFLYKECLFYCDFCRKINFFCHCPILIVDCLKYFLNYHVVFVKFTKQ